MGISGRHARAGSHHYRKATGIRSVRALRRRKVDHDNNATEQKVKAIRAHAEKKASERCRSGGLGKIRPRPPPNAAKQDKAVRYREGVQFPWLMARRPCFVCLQTVSRTCRELAPSVSPRSEPFPRGGAVQGNVRPRECMDNFSLSPIGERVSTMREPVVGAYSHHGQHLLYAIPASGFRTWRAPSGAAPKALPRKVRSARDGFVNADWKAT